MVKPPPCGSEVRSFVQPEASPGFGRIGKEDAGIATIADHRDARDVAHAVHRRRGHPAVIDRTPAVDHASGIAASTPSHDLRLLRYELLRRTMMDDYFLPDRIGAQDLRPFSDVLPRTFYIFAANLFADVFLMDASGQVHMLEVATGRLTRIANSEAEFRARIAEKGDEWLLRPLVDHCRALGKRVVTGRCYAYTVSPLFREGRYEADNVWVSPLREWLALSGDLHEQLGRLPDGAVVSTPSVKMRRSVLSRAVDGLRRLARRS
jgi:hypothetical protein